MTDLLLAIAHHLLVFLLAGVLFAEFVLLKPGLGGRDLKLLGGLDRVYGAVAGLIIIIGFCRVFFGLKGWEFYIYGPSFWAKMGAFLIVGLLSIPPTIRILKWVKQAKTTGSTYAVSDSEIAGVKRFFHAELVVFMLIPVFAAMMARGVGY